MSKYFLFAFLMIAAFDGFCQKEKLNNLVISIPVIFNGSEARFYMLGREQSPTGNGISYGVNLSYERSVQQNIYAMIGIGYFRQSFGIMRPFDFRGPTQALYHT